MASIASLRHHRKGQGSPAESWVSQPVLLCSGRWDASRDFLENRHDAGWVWAWWGFSFEYAID